jgi:hypothetical protein
MVQTLTQVKNRALAVLEDTNVKLSSVVSDPFGASGRKIMEALVDGERDCRVLSEMAMGVLRRKIPQLESEMRTICLVPAKEKILNPRCEARSTRAGIGSCGWPCEPLRRQQPNRQ